MANDTAGPPLEGEAGFVAAAVAAACGKNSSMLCVGGCTGSLSRATASSRESNTSSATDLRFGSPAAAFFFTRNDLPRRVGVAALLAGRPPLDDVEAARGRASPPTEARRCPGGASRVRRRDSICVNVGRCPGSTSWQSTSTS